MWLYFYPKNGGKRSFFYETNASISFTHNEKNVFMVPNHEKKEDYYVNLGLFPLKDELQF